METSVESSDLVAARRLSALRMSVRESNVNIALIGATGFVGSAILREALRRGHEVTAIVRHPEKLPPIPSFIRNRPMCPRKRTSLKR